MLLPGLSGCIPPSEALSSVWCGGCCQLSCGSVRQGQKPWTNCPMPVQSPVIRARRGLLLPLPLYRVVGGCGWLTLSAPPPLSSLLTAPAVRLPGFSSFPALQLAAIRCGGRGGAVHSLCHLQPSMLPRSSCALTAYLLRTCCALTAPAGGVGLVVFGGCPYAVTLAAAPSRRTRSTPHESSMSSATSIRFLTPC